MANMIINSFRPKASGRAGATIGEGGGKLQQKDHDFSPHSAPSNMGSSLASLNRLDDSMEGITHQRSRHTPLTFLLGTLRGQFLVLLITAIVLVFSGAGFWIWVDCGTSCDSYNNDWSQAMWFSWGVFFDPGTQTGIESTANGDEKVIAVLFSVLGFIFNLIFLGIIVEQVRQLLNNWRRFYGYIIENEHTVVLGWTDKTLFLLGELAQMMHDSAQRGGTIVVLGDMDIMEMKMELSVAFPNWRKEFPRVWVRYMEGKAFEVRPPPPPPSAPSRFPSRSPPPSNLRSPPPAPLAL